MYSQKQNLNEDMQKHFLKTYLLLSVSDFCIQNDDVQLKEKTVTHEQTSRCQKYRQHYVHLQGSL